MKHQDEGGQVEKAEAADDEVKTKLKEKKKVQADEDSAQEFAEVKSEFPEKSFAVSI